MDENTFNFSVCNRWFPPSGLPLNYVAFDLETTGFGLDDVPTQIGWIIVDNGQIVDQREVVLNWYSVESIDKQWLDNRMINVLAAFENLGLIYPVTVESMKGKGFPPADVLAAFGSVIQQCTDNRWPLVGHNIVRFDLTRLPKSFERLSLPFPRIDQNLLFDTQGADAGQQLLRRGDSKGFPMPGEPAGDYFARMCTARVENKSASRKLTKLAFNHKLPVGDDRHSALADTLLCHQLIEYWRGRPSFSLQIPTLPASVSMSQEEFTTHYRGQPAPATFSENPVPPPRTSPQRHRGQRQ